MYINTVYMFIPPQDSFSFPEPQQKKKVSRSISQVLRSLYKHMYMHAYYLCILVDTVGHAHFLNTHNVGVAPIIS